jgi:glycopeptide antibiotics resistance protein
LTSEQVSRSYQEWISGKTPLLSANSGCMALYLFDEREGKVVHNRVSAGGELMIPEVFAPLQRIVLISPWLDFEWSLEYFQDIAVNIIGFMPFGFFCAAFMFKAGKFRRKNLYLITALLGLGFGLAIELSQVYLPTRHSQLMDVIDNFAGTILGLILFHLVFDNKKTPAEISRRSGH